MSSITSSITQANNEFNQALSQQKGSALDKDSFMLLLVTQFKYQDPLNPMDDKEFIAQMAQFSSLEQLMNMNTSMEAQTEAINNQQMVNATSYIGKLVSVSGNTIGKTTDGSTNESTISTFRYAFGDNVVKGTLSVRDSSGNTIYTEDLAGKQAGTTFEFNWSGLTGAGEVAPDGVYSVYLSAFNSKGEAVMSDQVVDATVTGIVNQNGQVLLGMDGGQLLQLANIRQVTTPKVKQVTGTEEDKKDDENKDDEVAEAPEGNGESEAPEGTETPDNSGSDVADNDTGNAPADTPTDPVISTEGVADNSGPMVGTDYTL